MAGGLGWGIRGQYGHETGAMIAGLLVGLVLVLAAGRDLSAAAGLRAVAAGALGISFGGSMTYGQTLGLTHDPEMVGRWDVLGWGFLGVALKGGIWVGFAGVFLGAALGGVRFRAREVVLGWMGILAVCAVGIWIFNEPFDPDRRILPGLYFSDSWRWEPGADLKPRREVWGGLGLALAALLGVFRWLRPVPLAVRLGGWGVLAGALGFPAGQALQAFHAWNPDLFESGPWASADRVINWWNWMETTFGLVWGAVLAVGLLRNLDAVRVSDPPPGNPALPAAAEWSLLALHAGLVATAEFAAAPWVDLAYDFGLLQGFIPVVLVACGCRSHAWLAFPVTVLPIAGKTLREALRHGGDGPGPVPAALLLLMVPVGAACFLAARWRRDGPGSRPPEAALPLALVVVTWLFFLLNLSFFRFPWPWQPWTARTPNALMYLVCAAGLTGIALRARRRVP